MSAIQESFEIAYCSVTTKITPVVNDDRMQYIVSLPTRKVMLETDFDENELHFWKEVPGGKTDLAEEIGAIIERRDD